MCFQAWVFFILVVGFFIFLKATGNCWEIHPKKQEHRPGKSFPGKWSPVPLVGSLLLTKWTITYRHKEHVLEKARSRSWRRKGEPEDSSSSNYLEQQREQFLAWGLQVNPLGTSSWIALFSTIQFHKFSAFQK